MFKQKYILFFSHTEQQTHLSPGALQTYGFGMLKIEQADDLLPLVRERQIPLVVIDVDDDSERYAIIENLKSMDLPPSVVVVSNNLETSSIIRAMRQGAYDYIPKTIRPNELYDRVSAAFKVAHADFLQKLIEKEVKLRKETQVSIENILKTGVGMISRQSAAMIAGMRTSISQGPGFGALNSVIKLMKKKAKPAEKGSILPESLLEMLYENVEIVQRVIATLEKIDQVMNDGFQFETISLTDLLGFIREVVHEVCLEDTKWASRLKVSHKSIKGDHLNINVNKEALRLALRELIFNALKFSLPGSDVLLLYELSSSYKMSANHQSLILMFLNKPVTDQQGGAGILPKYRDLIFEPFYRVSRLVYEEYPTLDYGLGLPLVDAIARRHSGSVSGFNIVSHLSTEKPETLVDFELSLPLANS